MIWRIAGSQNLVDFFNFGSEEADSQEGQEEQARSYFESIFSVLRSNQGLVEYLSDTLV